METATNKSTLSCAVLNKYRKQEALQEKDEVLESKAFNANPSRFIQIQFKSFLVYTARPFSIAEQARIRRCLSLLCPKKLQVVCLNKAVSTLSKVGFEIKPPAF